MKNYIYHIKVLGFRLFLLLLLFQLTRLYFFIVNYNKFANLEVSEILWAFFVGFRFDMASIAVFNSVFLLLAILPFSFIGNRIYQGIMKFLFILINTPLLISNLVDSEYFIFTQKRSTFDIFDTLGDDDFSKMLGSYLKDYWPIFIISILLVFLMIKLYHKTKPIENIKNTVRFFIYKILIFLSITALTVIAIRGFDHRPIAITSAAKFANAETVSLVLNTPFTLLKTINKKSLETKHYFDNEEQLAYFSPIKQYNDSVFVKKNVVILILESFGKEYSALYNPSKIGYTPFLDSLSQKGLNFRYSFANGQRSMEAMSSIFNASPSLMNRPFVVSQYASNQTEGLAKILQKEGYYTSFMHGGSNGTMDFDKFCYMSGFKDYYGKNEYPNPKDFDGNWGIYDEPYLKYAAQEMAKFKTPFFNAIFTLSSHHPYSIPQKYQGHFPKGSLEIHESIGYSDNALKTFFAEAQKHEWYQNTLFVITADHTSMSEGFYYQRHLGNYSVPIVLYSPSDSLLKGYSNQLAQHIDIMPSILDYLGYSKPFYSLGSSWFDKQRQSIYINYLNDRYYFAKDELLCFYYDNDIQAIFKWKSDSILKRNLVQKTKFKQAFENNELNYMKALIQTYNHDLVNNKAFPEAYNINKNEQH